MSRHNPGLLLEFGLCGRKFAVVGSFVVVSCGKGDFAAEFYSAKPPQIFTHIGFSVIKPAEHIGVVCAFRSGEVISVAHQREEVLYFAAVLFGVLLGDFDCFGFYYDEGVGFPFFGFSFAEYANDGFLPNLLRQENSSVYLAFSFYLTVFKRFLLRKAIIKTTSKTAMTLKMAIMMMISLMFKPRKVGLLGVTGPVLMVGLL